MTLLYLTVYKTVFFKKTKASFVQETFQLFYQENKGIKVIQHKLSPEKI